MAAWLRFRLALSAAGMTIVVLLLLLTGPASAAEAAATSEALLPRVADAQASATAGDLTEADRRYQAIVRAAPADALAWTSYGEFLRFLVHDASAAKHAFQSALHLPGISLQLRAYALRGLGDIAGASGDSEGAIALLRQSLATYELAEAHRSLGVLLLVAHHDATGAWQQARAAVQQSPDEPLSLLVYAILCERLGHHEDGHAAFTRALSIAGCDGDGHADHAVHCCVFYNAACYLAVCGERARALTMLAAFFNAPNHLHRSRHEIEHDPDFSGLIANLDFIALLDRNLPQGDLAAAPPCTQCAVH